MAAQAMGCMACAGVRQTVPAWPAHTNPLNHPMHPHPTDCDDGHTVQCAQEVQQFFVMQGAVSLASRPAAGRPSAIGESALLGPCARSPAVQMRSSYLHIADTCLQGPDQHSSLVPDVQHRSLGEHQGS